MMKMITNQEINKLEEISQNSLYSSGVMQSAIAYCFQILSRNILGERVLELGPAEGVMTELLVKTGKTITIVEGSKYFCESLKRRFPKIEVVNCLFEKYEPEILFDTIVLGHVLEHVDDPIALLSKVKAWIKPGGRLFAAVPNAKSIHRQAAVLMGILNHESELNALDLHHGHRRVFDPDSFREIFNAADLKIEVFGGYWLKPLSNSQIELTWTKDMIDAFMILGERNPDIAGEIYAVVINEASSHGK